jgi:hypothetical protein
LGNGGCRVSKKTEPLTRFKRPPRCGLWFYGAVSCYIEGAADAASGFIVITFMKKGMAPPSALGASAQ